MKQNPRFRVAEIAVEVNEDGTHTFWAYNYGIHPAQGGMEVTYGNLGSADLEGLLNILKDRMIKDKDLILEQVDRRAKEISNESSKT